MNKLEIVYDNAGAYSYDDILDFFGFGKDVNIFTEKKSLLGIGPNNQNVVDLVSKYIGYYKMFLIPEEPNGFFIPTAYNAIIDCENNFDLIFSICKYTIEWRKNHFDIDKRIYVPSPFSNKFIYPNQEKTIPVYITAHNRPSPILPYMFRTVKKFGGTIVDASQYKPITHEEKMILNGKSKISITYSLLFVDNNHIASIKSLPKWQYNEAFKNLESGFVPQMKTRVYEAALSKSLILHKRDEWNIIEDWYTPEEDFIYFDDENDLLDKIDEINKNYHKYIHIAENAYNKTINNYISEHFIEKYIIPNTKLEV